ncbi:AraC family transcriptional regulator [Termitidicoccus mucosus]|uniref:HTH araC/xylS-type domain-containing protein n=1 Tax=Termitidicoccus mucosus TaxID=1184151 RepID=A0A178IDU1_9BACT|nr:hypothetical protein AW736_20670 [Opitutaceae bacterium TSB47]
MTWFIDTQGFSSGGVHAPAIAAPAPQAPDGRPPAAPAAAVAAPRRHVVRSGVCLHWGEWPPRRAPDAFRDNAARLPNLSPARGISAPPPLIRLVFVLADKKAGAASASLERMFVETTRGHAAAAALEREAAEPAFHVCISISGRSLRETLAGDDSRGAAFLLKIATGELPPGALPPLVLPPSARLAVESLRRCPFSGACRSLMIEARCNDMLVAFLSGLETWLEASADRAVKPVEGVRLATDLLLRRMDAPPSLAELARSVGLSETTLKRAFRAAHGTTVFGFLRALRMEHARALLSAGRASVIEVSSLVGYNNPSNFAAAFRRQFGQNPKRFQLADAT